MKISIDAITKGIKNGEVVWICDYRREDLNKKPQRSLKPTKVMVRPISDLPKNKTVYYSESYFSPLSSKTGLPLARVIAPYDNTGYRAYRGVPLNVFDDEKECVEFFHGQVEKVCEAIQEQIENASKYWRIELAKVKELAQ